MKLPLTIQNALASDPSLMATVNAAIEACDPIISSRPEFFPEYTDHGPSHNTEVLDTALGILTDDALNALSNADFAVLALAVLLHDCGMHLTGDAFVSLISQDNKNLTRLDEIHWCDLWGEFLLEAKRFDGRQLRNLYGSSEPISPPPEDPADYTMKHKLLIGEFLRRHHPRLAHDISVFGFPSASGGRVPILREQAGDLAEVSGLLARSHGMSLRRACDLFAEYFHEREFQGVHPPIVMAALRIADYLQIQPERAPKSELRLRKLRSPFSAGEWQVHQSVRNITPADNDPEAIFVDARPENVETFLKFKQWAESFQSELDLTWAAIGEVYGRYGQQGFDKFQLKLRRLRTSIDDLRKFSKSSSYIPAKIAFDASSPDLLGLLVAPLYGNRPEVGLRELIQNSLDAVIEREHIQGTAPSEVLRDFDTDVIVYPVFDGDEITTVIVEDRGIGMSPEVVQNYFLRAGASFRSSPQWKKAFTASDGHSDVARTGRFGIGALAGFLLGSTIEVVTRRYDESEGIAFTAEIDKEAIEVRKCACPIGTKISIHIDPEKRTAAGRLFSDLKDGEKDWDWYCNSYPKLTRLDKSSNEISPRFVYSEGAEWVPVEVSGYSKAAWSRVGNPRGIYGALDGFLFCNGIFVCRTEGYGNSSEILLNKKVAADISLVTPTVLLTDKDGHLPVNLQRHGLSDKDESLSSALKMSMARDLIAETIAFAPEANPFTSEGRKQVKQRSLSARFRSRVDRYDRLSRPHWCWEDDGWRLADLTLATHKPYLLVLYSDAGVDFLNTEKSFLSDVSVVWQQTGASAGNQNDLRSFFRNLVREDFWCRSKSTGFGWHLPFATVHSSNVQNKLFSGALPNYLHDFFRNSVSETEGVVEVRNAEIDHPLISRITKELREGPMPQFSFTLAAGKNRTVAREEDDLVPLWSEFIGDQPIPVDFEQRKAAFPKAFEQLGKRIDYFRGKLLRDGG